MMLSSKRRKSDEKPNIDDECSQLKAKIEKDIMLNEANLKNRQREIYQTTIDKITEAKSKSENYQTKIVEEAQAKVKHIQSSFKEARKLQAELESEMLKIANDSTENLQTFFNEEVESFWNEFNSSELDLIPEKVVEEARPEAKRKKSSKSAK